MGDNVPNVNAAVAVAPDLPAQPAPPPFNRVRGPPVPQKPLYTLVQKQRAIHWLNIGIPCRQVAAMIGHRCNSGTVCRWRKEARETKTARRRLKVLMSEARKGRRV